MTVSDAIKSRQSCRRYCDKPVLHEDLLEILSLAQNSPSACNSQPYKVILAEKEIAKQVPQFLQDDDQPINKWTNQASAFYIICETKAQLMKNARVNSQHYAQMDIGMLTAHITLLAQEKNIASCILGYFNENELKKLFSIPEDIAIRLVVAVGYPETDLTRQKIRKNFTDYASINSWEE